MIRRTRWVVAASFLAAATLTAQAKLSTQWEELTAGDFRQGIQHLLPFFAQAQLDKPHDFVVYVLDGERSRPGGPAKKSTGIDYHAGENETANTMVSHPDLVHLDRAASESGADLKRLNLPEELYTGIWWYARFPNHYSGDGSVARKELGDWNMKGWIDSIVECLRAVKADDASLKIQNEFYEKSKHPLDTRP